MKRAHQYLNSKGKSPREIKDFKQQLYDLWFKLYRRTKGSRALDSSGFEHVFVGETRGGTEVLGFHNWIQFYLQEKAGNIDYQGYILGKKVPSFLHNVHVHSVVNFCHVKFLQPELGANSHLLTLQFKWNREVNNWASVASLHACCTLRDMPLHSG